jgi:hypothetical protein
VRRLTRFDAPRYNDIKTSFASIQGGHKPFHGHFQYDLVPTFSELVFLFSLFPSKHYHSAETIWIAVQAYPARKVVAELWSGIRSVRSEKHT